MSSKIANSIIPKLPSELLGTVLSYIEPRDLITVSLVSKSGNAFVWTPCGFNYVNGENYRELLLTLVAHLSARISSCNVLNPLPTLDRTFLRLNKLAEDKVNRDFISLRKYVYVEMEKSNKTITIRELLTVIKVFRTPEFLLGFEKYIYSNDLQRGSFMFWFALQTSKVKHVELLEKIKTIYFRVDFCLRKPLTSYNDKTPKNLEMERKIANIITAAINFHNVEIYKI